MEKTTSIALCQDFKDISLTAIWGCRRLHDIVHTNTYTKLYISLCKYDHSNENKKVWTFIPNHN